MLYAQAPEAVHARRSRFAYAVHDDMMWYLGKPYQVMLAEGLTHPDQPLSLEPLFQVDQLMTQKEVSATVLFWMLLFAVIVAFDSAVVLGIDADRLSEGKCTTHVHL